MLPDFPALRKTLDDEVRFRIHVKGQQKAVVTSLIRGIFQHEGTRLSYHQEGTGDITEGYKAVDASFRVSVDEIPDLFGEKLDAKIELMAEEMARKTSKLFYDTLDKITAESGTSTDAGGPLTKEMALELHERVQWSPSSFFLAHPTMAKAMSDLWREWQSDKAFMEKFNEIDRRKKEEWRDRESNRKLVD